MYEVHRGTCCIYCKTISYSTREVKLGIKFCHHCCAIHTQREPRGNNKTAYHQQLDSFQVVIHNKKEVRNLSTNNISIKLLHTRKLHLHRTIKCVSSILPRNACLHTLREYTYTSPFLPFIHPPILHFLPSKSIIS